MSMLAFPPEEVLAQRQSVDIQKLERQIQSVMDKARRCTVGVGASGSGVIVSKTGLVLTCAHVTKVAGQKVVITFPDGRRVKATTLGNYHTADASVVQIDEPGDYSFLEMARSADVRVGDWAMAIGYPVTFSKRQLPPVRIGRVVRSSQNSLISDAPIMGGDSGGPLVSLSGKVIGVSSRVSSNVASNVHVPIDQYHTHWKRLLASEDWGPGARRNKPRKQEPRAAGGSAPKVRAQSPAKVRSVQAESDPFKRLGIGLTQTKQGVQIESLADDSLAQDSGLRVGHIFRKIGKASVKDLASCRQAIRAHLSKKRDNVSVTVARAEAEHALVVVRLRLKENE
ncbi:MAG: S1C family serine protease [Planctomycetaceae bacterium]